jgi:hypothetical protein
MTKSYHAAQVAELMLEERVAIDDFGGTGRIYVPWRRRPGSAGIGRGSAGG